MTIFAKIQQEIQN